MQPGQTISHYRILGKLGEGGMGVVYKAEDTKLDRFVALKFLPPHLSADADAKKRFIYEAKSASALEHPNIVAIYEIDDTPDGQTFIAMSYYEGASLKEMIEEGPLPIETAVGLATQIASGLSAAHKKNIVHRDIKPANILITDENQAKIVDFGLAKLSGRTRMTKTGTSLGTVAYMSPEQASGGESDARSDVFSLGVVLYETLTGRLPFSGEHEAAILYGIINTNPDPLRKLRSELSEDLERVVARSLAKKPAERYQTAEEFETDLKRIQAGYAPLAPKPSRFKLKVLMPASMIALGLALFLILKPFGVRLDPDQAAEAAVNSLAIMYFDNMADTEDPHRLGEIVTSLLITDLSESQYLNVVSSQRLYDILKQEGIEGVTALDKTVATRVATRAGAKWMLLGNILQEEPNYLVTAQLVEVETGNIAGTQRISGRHEEKIFSLVDRLTVQIRSDLALSAEAGPERDRSVAAVTTQSEEAYRYYIEGMENLYRGHGKEAKVSFEKALAYDSTFAMAYMRLLDDWVPGTEAEKIPWLEKAVLYAEGASKKEQLYIMSESAAFSLDDAKAIEGYETIIDMYPDEKRAYYELGGLYWGQGDLDLALENYNKVIEIDPLDKLTYNSLAYLYDFVGDIEKSIWAINQYIALAPDEAGPYDTRGDLYAFHGKIDEAIDSYKQALEQKPDYMASLEKLGHMYLFKQDYAKAETYYRQIMGSTDEAERAWGRYLLAGIPLYQGKWDRALEVLNQGIAADEIEGIQAWGYWWKLVTKAVIYAEKKDLERALAETNRLVRSYEEAYPENPRVWGNMEVYFLVMKGDLSRATEVANALNKVTGDDTWQYWVRKGWIEQASGTMDAACTSFEKAVEFWGKSFFARYHLALAYLKAGRLADAVDEFERLLKRFGQNRATNTRNAVRAYYHLGVAYEQSGWYDKAIEQYEEFLDIWKDADPGTEEVEDAKRRLAVLKG